MALVIELRTETGEVLARTGEINGAVPVYLPPFEDEEFKTIRYIDRYGDTIFNGRQMQAVIPELYHLRDRAASDRQNSLIDEIIDLAHQCESGVHRYLVFVGD